MDDSIGVDVVNRRTYSFEYGGYLCHSQFPTLYLRIKISVRQKLKNYQFVLLMVEMVDNFNDVGVVHTG